MGNVYPTIPAELAKRLVVEAGLTGAVETGTFHGVGALALRQLVSHVWTIELSEKFHAQAVARYGGRDGITFLQGESSEELRRLSDAITGPLLFWLDAHGGTDLFDLDDTHPQCPLLGELRAIDQFAQARQSCILIDDARFILGPVAGPHIEHRTRDWPTLVEILDALGNDKDRYTTILDDVIICVPSYLRKVVDAWWLDLSTQRLGDEAFEYQLRLAVSPTPALAAKRLVKSVVPSGLKARWYAMRGRTSTIEANEGPHTGGAVRR